MSEKDYVTADECEARQKCLLATAQNFDLKEHGKLWGSVRENQANIKNVMKTQTWFMGIIASVLGGLLIWLITRG